MDTDRGPRSVSAEIQNPVQMPVLADGLFVHQAKADAPFETDVTLPNISCRRCTLQVIQFMEQHAVNNPGMFTYHHCATVQITAGSEEADRRRVAEGAITRNLYIATQAPPFFEDSTDV